MMFIYGRGKHLAEGDWPFDKQSPLSCTNNNTHTTPTAKGRLVRHDFIHHERAVAVVSGVHVVIACNKQSVFSQFGAG
jgi:hypothetical protein